ncbi:hypothetical protein UlMin_028852, partial [Ulmus minor]
TAGEVRVPPCLGSTKMREKLNILSVYIYMHLLGYPANKISILTTYNRQKLLIRHVINRRCVPYDFIGPPSKVATVYKFQGQQNDFILLRLVVATSCARLSLYVFCRCSQLELCYELQPTFQLLLKRPDSLAFNLTGVSSYTECQVEDTGPLHLVGGVDDMNIVYQQLYQAKFGQYMAYSGQVAPGLIERMSKDVDGVRESGPDEKNTEDKTKMEVLANGESGGVQSESHSKGETDLNVVLPDNDSPETKMEE